MLTPPPQALATAAQDEGSSELHRRRRLITVYEVIGSLMPLVVAWWAASSRVLSFDGAMNMQVAQNLADRHVFGRNYGGMVVFPSEIQTSSYFIVISAIAIALFGATNLTLQSANLVFIVVLAFAISRASGPSRVAAVVLPSAVIFGVPGLLEYSLIGYGEGSVAGLALIAFLLLARALDGSPRAYLLVGLAFIALGVAISIKTVAMAALVPALLGYGLVVMRSRPRPLRLLLAPLAGGVPLALFEVYRLLVLRGTYFAYWKSQVRDIVYQAGGDSTRSAGTSDGSLTKIADHLNLLEGQTGVAGGWWVLALLIAPIAAFVAVRSRHAWNQQLASRSALVVMLVVYAELYFTWWLAITPTEKAWLRRIDIGIFALTMALLLTAGILISRSRHTVPAARWRRLVGGATAVLTLVPLAMVALQGIDRNVSWLNSKSPTKDAVQPLADDVREMAANGASPTKDAVQPLADDVREMAANGAQFYGVGWWSAPVVSLYSGVNFDDLSTADLCLPDARAAVANGDAYLVWDFYAEALANEAVPSWPGLDLERSGVSTGYGALWRISVPADKCAS